jgi:hypothetical protein
LRGTRGTRRRRARRARRAWAGVGATRVAAVAVTAFMVAPGQRPKQAVAPLKGPEPVLAASSTSTAIKQPAGPKSPVTDAAMVEQLTRLLPPGRTSGYAGGPKEENRYAFGQVYLDAPAGSLLLDHSSIAPPMRRRCFRNVYDGSAARLVR